MHSSKTIMHAKRLDPARKKLVKQITESMAKNAALTPKRIGSSEINEYHNMDTLKKKQHFDMNRNAGQGRNKTFQRVKQVPIKSSQYLSSLKESNRNDIYQQNDPDCFKEQQIDHSQNNVQKIEDRGFIFNKKPLDFGFSAYSFDNEILNQKQRLLISIQQKLDDYLMFLKENRKKKKGQFFTHIKKHFLQNHRIFLDFTHIKKILFIDQNLYTIEDSPNGMQMDCLIDVKLPELKDGKQNLSKNQQPNQLSTNYKQRNNEFHLKLQQFVLLYRPISQSNGLHFDIPCVNFEFEQKWLESKNTLKKSMKELFGGELVKKNKIDRFFVLQNKKSQRYKQNRKYLTKGLQKVQKIINKQKQMDLCIFLNKMFVKKLLSRQEIDKIIEEINLIYRNKNVTNINQNLLIQNLNKKIILSEQILTRIIEILIEFSLTINATRPFMKALNHPKAGKLIQFDRNSLKQFKHELLGNEQWLNKFEFEIQMNEQYRKLKVQQIRQKTLNEMTQTQNKQKFERENSINEHRIKSRQNKALQQSNFQQQQEKNQIFENIEQRKEQSLCYKELQIGSDAPNNQLKQEEQQKQVSQLLPFKGLTNVQNKNIQKEEQKYNQQAKEQKLEQCLVQSQDIKVITARQNEFKINKLQLDLMQERQKKKHDGKNKKQEKQSSHQDKLQKQIQSNVQRGQNVQKKKITQQQKNQIRLKQINQNLNRKQKITPQIQEAKQEQPQIQPQDQNAHWGTKYKGKPKVLTVEQKHQKQQQRQRIHLNFQRMQRQRQRQNEKQRQKQKQRQKKVQNQQLKQKQIKKQKQIQKNRQNNKTIQINNLQKEYQKYDLNIKISSSKKDNTQSTRYNGSQSPYNKNQKSKSQAKGYRK